jgi:hypothetical protein
MRQIGRTPLTAMLLEAIDDGLAHHHAMEEVQRAAQS